MDTPRFVIQDEQQPDVQCILAKCGFKLAKCTMSSQCRQTADCMRQCDPKAGDYQQCTSNCFFLYADEAFNALTGCMLKNECIAPMTWSNQTCPPLSKLKNAARIKSFPVTALSDTKTMYVARGADPIFDCLPCQTLKFAAVDKGTATTWSADLTSMINKTAKSDGVIRSSQYTLGQYDSNTLKTKYSLFGMPVAEEYYILDAVFQKDGLQFVLYFYCGFGFGGEYQGSLVYTNVPNSQVPRDVDERFRDVMAKMDLSPKWVPPYADYCKPSYDKCKN